MLGPCLVKQYLICHFTKEGAVGSFTILSSCCHVDFSVMCIFLIVPCFGQQCVVLAFPGNTYLLFKQN